MSMTRYTVGLLFDRKPHRDHVLLLKKRRGPPSVVGKWNGPGGKAATGEGMLESMRREYREETGLDVDSWKLGVVIHGGYYEIYFFYADYKPEMGEARSVTDENVEWRRLKDQMQTFLAPHLAWIIPLCLDTDIKEFVRVNVEVK